MAGVYLATPSHKGGVHSFFVRSFFGATMEVAAGMLIHSTALRPVTTRPSAHPQRVCSVCRCCVATVVMTACL